MEYPFSAKQPPEPAFAWSVIGHRYRGLGRTLNSKKVPMDEFQPLDLVTTLNTLIAESDYCSYGYRLPGHKPQILGCLIANYFDLDQHAIALCAISLLEYIGTDGQSGNWYAGPGNTTKLDD
jgi:hypothetical protein